ncbi:hypothetical protein [Metabacillus fastidiosus]|uniref:hypothetical protein n=1 Tax=Metabacillus fastidiosus TaxID=1458 RepID=UPI002E1E9F95|nr:hypothetical protein [Metabacillus fastidiosus]
MQLLEKVLLEELKNDPSGVRELVLNMDTLDMRTKTQIVTLSFLYENEGNYELQNK